ncbi:copper amine oxidase N-terminal domain-containing protein [Paenibacillus hexagrammi]|uniref:Copper amine oxidase N-terminal domain-containing protein n=1 Tax=Paenibacillus hexagrammi TaxID=2908839 RepID=A0ABY3SPV9_9BACL|nr:copper amine oxidase N-terminal domain-containing protein [Paenibacillus sp. YPD9-1]UJF36033.1 copper amine oxidase N-terminal domain-containing protein [Paenibacillus sp. YPD9-1]
MKKFVLGFVCGAVLTSTTAVYASSTIQAYLFPVTYQINHQSKDTPSGYTTINYEGHAYVPIRFVAESLGLGIRYADRNNIIEIMKEPSSLDENAKKVWSVQYRLTNSQDQSYVKELLGMPSIEQEEVWRYDLSPVDKYTWREIDHIDVHGLENGDLQAQIIIHWTPQQLIQDVEMWYTDQEGHLMTYYLYQDGSTASALYE